MVSAVFLGFFGMLTEEDKSWRNIWLMAAGLSAIALTSQYYLYLTLLVSGLILLIYFLVLRRDRFLNGCSGNSCSWPV
jgi:hypothetical protein